MIVIPDSLPMECPTCHTIKQGCPCEDCRGMMVPGQVIACATCLTILLILCDMRLAQVEEKDVDNLTEKQKTDILTLGRQLAPIKLGRILDRLALGSIIGMLLAEDREGKYEPS